VLTVGGTFPYPPVHLYPHPARWWADDKLFKLYKTETEHYASTLYLLMCAVASALAAWGRLFVFVVSVRPFQGLVVSAPSLLKP
jgi:hypothetical protein